MEGQPGVVGRAVDLISRIARRLDVVSAGEQRKFENALEKCWFSKEFSGDFTTDTGYAIVCPFVILKPVDTGQCSLLPTIRTGNSTPPSKKPTAPRRVCRKKVTCKMPSKQHRDYQETGTCVDRLSVCD